MSAVLEKPKAALMLSPARHAFYQHQNQRHVITAEEGTLIEDVLRPEFLGHIAQKLRLYDEVVVRTDDGAYWAELLVLQTGATWARTKMLRHVKLQDDALLPAADPMNPYDIAFKGPVRKWVMFRKADNEMVREGLETKGEAARYMADYIRQTTGG